MITAQTILQNHDKLLLLDSGSIEKSALRVTIPELASSDSMVFASKAEQLEQALKRNAAIVIAIEALKPIATNSTTTVFTTRHMQVAMAELLTYFDQKNLRFAQEDFIHSTAIIHPSASIAAGVVIGPHVVIGANVRIGTGSRLGANSVLEMNSSLGENCILHPQVFIGANCILGNRVEIHPHTSIGSDGYGYITTKPGVHKKIPQLGIVVIEDDVEIGSNCAIDRATLHETRIGKGSKLDNLIHIAHNCSIGEGCFLTAGFMTAGSTQIGHRFMCGGGVVVADHKTICPDVIVAGRSTITSNITEPGQYGGFPLQPMRDYLKNSTVIPHLAKMKKQISALSKKLGIED